MRYLVTPSAYKGSFSPAQIANAISDGIKRFDPDSELVLAPIADGGDGTIEALRVGTGGVVHTLDVQGPTGQEVTAQWLEVEQSPNTDEDFSFVHPDERKSKPLAVAELASACGLAYLAPQDLAPLDSTTVGAGEVLKHLIAAGHRNVVLAVGGSASTDGGTGILHAMGARFFDTEGNALPPAGRSLPNIKSVDLSALQVWKHGLRLRVATDVINPLLGADGAAAIFAPQKGASPADVELLENGLRNLADVLESHTGKLARDLTGAGAAGGVPFGLAVALDAEIIPGFRWIASLLDLDAKVQNADVVISAEGSLDSQSVSGKATGELAQMCKDRNKPLWVIPAIMQPDIHWPTFGIAKVKASAHDGNLATIEDVADAAYQLCLELSNETAHRVK
ncbi:glycerate kinase [Candidatus Obscuribacterales bacterium]|nr:glycerate kinase [Candidatus Obscuribacterales bacterium]